jgi:hypothetical protein
MLYFGPWDRAGHYFFDEHGRRSMGHRFCPWTEGQIDGKLQPQESRASGKYQVEGVALVHHKDGWTALSFWDRSVDRRGNCNSTYFAEGIYGFDQMVSMARVRFAKRWEVMTFELTKSEQ